MSAVKYFFIINGKRKQPSSSSSWLLCQSLRWWVNDLRDNPCGRAGVTHESIWSHVSSTSTPALHLEASLKPLRLTLITTLHPDEWNKTYNWKSVSTRCSQSQAATHHLFLPLPAFLHHPSWSSQGVHEKGNLTGFVFSSCRSILGNLRADGRGQTHCHKIIVRFKQIVFPVFRNGCNIIIIIL